MASRLEPGDPAPAFTLPADDGTSVSLSDFAGKKVVVYFYPAAMTPGCTTQACDFRDNLASLGGAGLDVLGISPYSPAKLAKFREAEQLVQTSQALLVAGSSLVVNSGIRLVERARRRRLPVVIVNRGATRADGRATVKIDAGTSEVLTALARALPAQTDGG